jgi:hypothetical protein
MGGKIGNDEVVACGCGGDLFTVRFAFGGELQIE